MSKKTPDGPHPPTAIEAEQSVIGAILIHADTLDEVMVILEPSDFYRAAHRTIYQVMLHLWNNGQVVDLVTVSQALRDAGLMEEVGGVMFLAGLSENVGVASNAKQYAEIVRQKAVLRNLLEAARQIESECLDGRAEPQAALNRAEEWIYQVRDSRETASVYGIGDLIDAEVEHLEGLFSRTGELLGVPSGLRDLDHLTGGWSGGNLIILAARTSMGKTALATNMGINAAVRQHPVLFFSLEQPRGQIVQRLLSSWGGVNHTKLRLAKMNTDEWGKMQEAAGAMAGLPFYLIDQPALTVQEIRGYARRTRGRYNIKLIIVDYLQLIKARGSRNREQEVAEISKGLKSLAKELEVPVVALSQLNRKVEERPNKRPLLSDLRESGSIEQDADEVVFIYRDEVYNENTKEPGVAEIRVAKQRNGPTGRIKVGFQKEFMRFVDLEGGKGW